MPYKILIIGPAWVGDMVMAQALFMQLKQIQPDVIIDVLAPAWTNALLERMPEVRRAIALPIAHGQFDWKQRWQLGKQLRLEKYDQAIVLPNSWKSALIPFIARIPKRTGWLGEMRFGLLNDARYLNKQSLPLMVQRFVALALEKADQLPKDFPKPALQVSSEQQIHTTAKFALTTTAPVLALCPGAEFGAAKRWPVEYFAEIARQQLAAGWQVWLFGSHKDQAITAEIQNLTQQACMDLAGKTTLAEAIDLLSLANIVISNDSGLMHIAAALQRSLVAIYGSSSPRFTPPLSDRVKILSIDLACAPCFQRECPLGHLQCLRELAPNLVMQAMAELAL